MSALTGEDMRPIRTTPDPDTAARLREQAEKILGRRLADTGDKKHRKTA